MSKISAFIRTIKTAAKASKAWLARFIPFRKRPGIWSRMASTISKYKVPITTAVAGASTSALVAWWLSASEESEPDNFPPDMPAEQIGRLRMDDYIERIDAARRILSDIRSAYIYGAHISEKEKLVASLPAALVNVIASTPDDDFADEPIAATRLLLSAACLGLAPDTLIGERHLEEYLSSSYAPASATNDVREDLQRVLSVSGISFSNSYNQSFPFRTIKR